MSVACEHCHKPFAPSWQPIPGRWLCVDCLYDKAVTSELVYRIVRVEEKSGQIRYNSACYHPSEWNTVLVPGEKQTNLRTGLFAFRRLEDALKYLAALKDTEYEPILQVWLAEATNVRGCPQRLPRHSTDYQAYWEGKDSTGEMFDVPPGTVLCDSIKLLRHVIQ